MWTLICITTKNEPVKGIHRFVSPTLRFDTLDCALLEMKRDMADAIEGEIDNFLEDHITEEKSEVYVYYTEVFEYMYVIQKIET